MMPVSQHARGRPVYALTGVILLYVGIRAVWWQSPFPALYPIVEWPEEGDTADRHDQAFRDLPTKNEFAGSADREFDEASMLSWTKQSTSLANRVAAARELEPMEDRRQYAEVFDPPTFPTFTAKVGKATTGTNMLDGAPVTDVPSTIASKPVTQPSSAKRWSLDGWLFYRQDDASDVRRKNGFRAPTYGASQAGLIFRYQLAPDNSRAPTSYFRVTTALNADGEQDVAVGASARPLPDVPAVFAAEIRVSRQGNRTEIRPAILAYTEIPFQRLPNEFRAEIYGQGGYVGGAFATPFVDGAVRIDRKLRSFDIGEVRAGGGVWGGAQKDIARLDVGPTVTLNVNVKGAPVRLAADYRYRIAGNAEPRSELAITASTGF